MIDTEGKLTAYSHSKLEFRCGICSVHLLFGLGPKDEFRLPSTTMMDYGWYKDDPELCENWFLVRNPAPKVSSDATR